MVPVLLKKKTTKKQKNWTADEPPQLRERCWIDSRSWAWVVQDSWKRYLYEMWHPYDWWFYPVKVEVTLKDIFKKAREESPSVAEVEADVYSLWGRKMTCLFKKCHHYFW